MDECLVPPVSREAKDPIRRLHACRAVELHGGLAAQEQRQHCTRARTRVSHRSAGASASPSTRNSRARKGSSPWLDGPPGPARKAAHRSQGDEEDLSLVTGTDAPGVALPGGGAGAAYKSPLGKLSKLIATLNEKFRMNLTDADKVWFQQQKQAVKDNRNARVVALNNDRDQYSVVLDKIAENAIIERHESNGQLFNAYFEKPGFREALMEYLASSYDEIRDEDASSPT